MKIGELSKLTGVSVRSLRYYEQQGLITPQRLDNGYREYHVLTVEQVNTIQFYLKLGLSTEQISRFLQCVLISKEAFCKEVMPIYQARLKELNEQINQLTLIKSNLEERIQAIQADCVQYGGKLE
ncbi:MerR family transcriptional regulator [Paenibacillus albiflavus]|uniref:MerR family transcriptional regulator n=1 Tax=Paenibacillus albiflavus TaxID=2545760 RepID=A0A4R4EME6_9BACL|nr:MerR family transcriptional regulator [Paenibacillus albiflavus]TCZ80997.1 MerR family transcriptional regulator [Paenibacillus albiflavus]